MIESRYEDSRAADWRPTATTAHGGNAQDQARPIDPGRVRTGDQREPFFQLSRSRNVEAVHRAGMARVAQIDPAKSGACGRADVQQERRGVRVAQLDERDVVALV